MNPIRRRIDGVQYVAVVTSTPQGVGVITFTEHNRWWFLDTTRRIEKYFCCGLNLLFAPVRMWRTFVVRDYTRIIARKCRRPTGWSGCGEPCGWNAMMQAQHLVTSCHHHPKM